MHSIEKSENSSQEERTTMTVWTPSECMASTCTNIHNGQDDIAVHKNLETCRNLLRRQGNQHSSSFVHEEPSCLLPLKLNLRVSEFQMSKRQA